MSDIVNLRIRITGLYSSVSFIVAKLSSRLPYIIYNISDTAVSFPYIVIIHPIIIVVIPIMIFFDTFDSNCSVFLIQ